MRSSTLRTLVATLIVCALSHATRAEAQIWGRIKDHAKQSLDEETAKVSDHIVEESNSTVDSALANTGRIADTVVGKVGGVLASASTEATRAVMSGIRNGSSDRTQGRPGGRPARRLGDTVRRQFGSDPAIRQAVPRVSASDDRVDAGHLSPRRARRSRGRYGGGPVSLRAPRAGCQSVASGSGRSGQPPLDRGLWGDTARHGGPDLRARAEQCTDRGDTAAVTTDGDVTINNLRVGG